MNTDQKLIEMEDSLELMNHKLDEVLSCIKGNDIGTVGLVRELSDLKERFNNLEKQSSKDKTEAQIYLTGIKWLGRILGLLILTYIFNQILNK